jgi:hypothetical protein
MSDTFMSAVAANLRPSSTMLSISVYKSDAWLLVW